MLYGHRARIGYTCPPSVAEVFPYEFYMAAPKGVTLLLTTLEIVEKRTDGKNTDEIDRSYDISMIAAKEMVAAGAQLVCFGGVPINLSRGTGNAEALIRETAAEVGRPITTSLECQMKGLKQVGAQKVAVVHPMDEDDAGPKRLFKLRLDNAGFEYVGCAGARCQRPIELGNIPLEAPLELGRQVIREHPEADTILVTCPHWAVNSLIDEMEQELQRPVVTSSQSIIWHSLRLCGIEDRVEGFGTLLRDN